MDEKNIKKESGTKSEIREDIKHEPGPLWEGEVRFKTEEGNEEIRADVLIFQKDDSKNGCKLFDWASQGKL